MHQDIAGHFIIVVATGIIFTLLPLILRASVGKTVFTVGCISGIRGVAINRISPKKRRMTSTTTIEAAFGNDTLLKRIDADHVTVFGVLDGLNDKNDVFIIAKATWCPDCQAVPSMITGLKRYATEKGTLLTIVLCDVGSRELWKSGAHPLKSSTGDAPSLRLAGVPMLIKWANGTEGGRLTAGLTDGSAFQQGEGVVSKTVTDWLKSL